MDLKFLFLAALLVHIALAKKGNNLKNKSDESSSRNSEETQSHSNESEDRPSKSSRASKETESHSEETQSGSEETQSDSNDDSKGASDKAIEKSLKACQKHCPKKFAKSCQQAKRGLWKCLIVDCGIPNQVGYVFGDGVPDTKFDSVVAVSCAEGYVIEPDISSLRCKADGTWEAATGCERIDCGIPSQTGYDFDDGDPDTKLDNCGIPSQTGYDFDDGQPDTKLDSLAAVSCAEGYVTEPDISASRCKADGTWEVVTGCERIDCGYPTQQGYDFPAQIDDTQFGSTVEAEACAFGYILKPDDQELMCKANGEWEPASGCSEVDCGPWYLAYEHNANGNSVSGSKLDLINKLKNGASIRVANTNGDFYVTSIQNAIQVGSEVCAQALMHISINGFDKFQDDAYWWFLTICTTGHWQASRYFVGSHTLKSKTVQRNPLKWFVRDHSTQKILSVSSSGAVTTGSITDLVGAIDYGHDIRLTLGTYFVPLDSLEYNSDKSLVTGTAIWAVSQKNVQRNGVTVKDFTNNPYWWFTLYASDAGKKATRWDIGEHNKRGDSSGTTSSEWFDIPCWRRVYEHSEYGVGNLENVAALITAIEAGHGVKMLSGGILLEADTVYVIGGKVCASFMNDLSKTSIDTFETSSLKWVWRVACTDGTLETVRYNVGGTIKTSSSVNAAMVWFMDMRIWNKVLSVDASGTVLSGNKADLVSAIQMGSEVRSRILYNGYSVYRQADNVKIKNGEVAVMHVRSIIEDSANPSFTCDTFWYFTQLTTLASLDISRWDVGAHNPRSHDSINVHAEFFINESQ